MAGLNICITLLVPSGFCWITVYVLLSAGSPAERAHSWTQQLSHRTSTHPCTQNLLGWEMSLPFIKHLISFSCTSPRAPPYPWTAIAHNSLVHCRISTHTCYFRPRTKGSDCRRCKVIKLVKPSVTWSDLSLTKRTQLFFCHLPLLH